MLISSSVCGCKGGLHLLRRGSWTIELSVHRSTRSIMTEYQGCLQPCAYDLRPVRHCEGGVKLLIDQLEKGGLDIRAESVLSTVAGSPHFPASQLEGLGFMEALVARLIQLGGSAGATSAKPLWPSLSPEVDRARWTWLMCGCISRLLVKHDIGGASQVPPSKALHLL